MKLLPLVFLNLATVGVALVAYDQLRSHEAAPVQASTVRVDTHAIEERLAALEAGRRPLLRGPRAEVRVVERLDALEKRVEALGEAQQGPSIVAATAEATVPLAEAPSKTGEEPSAEDVANFRRLEAAAKRADRARKYQTRVDAALDEAGVRLTGEERKQIVAALAEFEPRRTELWEEAKSRGAAAGEEADWRAIITETSTAIQGEFAERISDFVHPSDAVVIAAALNPEGK